METKTTLLRLSLIALMLFISSTAFSATYYVCSGGTVTLKPTAPAATITYTWDVKPKAGGASVLDFPKSITPNASGEYILTLPTATAADAYIISLISSSSDAAVCAPDVAQQEVVVLPPLAITIGAPSNPSYCGTISSPSSTITPTATGFPVGVPYSADLEYEYTYMVSKDGATAVNGTTYGTINATTGVYTLTATGAGTYVITGTVKYKNKTGGTSTLAPSSNGCPATSTTRTVTVTSAPAAPSISVM